MSLIEGVDDEIVVALGTFVFVSTAVALAWRSTRVQQQQPPPVEETSAASNSSESEATSPVPDESNDTGNISTGLGSNDEPPSDGEAIKLKLKFLNDTERTVDVTDKWTIGHLKRIHLAVEMDGGRKNVRLVFRGRELAEASQTLSSAGLSNMTTIHCLISERRQPAEGQQQRQQQQSRQMPRSHVNPNLDNMSDYDEVGRLLMPLLTIVLGCVWYARIRYRSLFDGFSSLALIAFTLAFLAVVAAHFYRLLGYGQTSNDRNAGSHTGQQAAPRLSPTGNNSSTNVSSNDEASNVRRRGPTSDESSTYPSYPPPAYSPPSTSSTDHLHAE